jgi:sigma-B regulation protein RsbU (phosphoserine phosphatase)
MRDANAGHPKPLHLLREAKRVALLGNAEGKSQPALGLFEDAVYLTTEQKLTPGDVVMLFTDGVYEVEDEREELYTQAMLVRDVQKRMQLPVGQLFDGLLKEVREFSAGGFTDDVCLVGMEYRGGMIRGEGKVVPSGFER